MYYEYCQKIDWDETKIDDDEFIDEFDYDNGVDKIIKEQQFDGEIITYTFIAPPPIYTYDDGLINTMCYLLIFHFCHIFNCFIKKCLRHEGDKCRGHMIFR